MDRIIVNGVDLVLPQNAFLPLRQSSPLFSYDGLPGAWSLPITVPYKENAIILGLPANPAVILDSNQYSCTVIVQGTWKSSGTITVVSANKNTMELSISIPFVAISEGLAATPLNEVALGSFALTTAPTVYVDFICSGSGDETDFNINTSYAGYEYTTGPGDTADEIIDAVALLINADTPASNIVCTNEGGGVLRLSQTTPGPRVTAFSFYGMSQSGGGITCIIDRTSWIKAWHDDLKAAIYTNRNQYYPNVNCCFPVVRHQNFYPEDTNPDYQGFINFYDTLNGTYVLNYNPSGGAWLGNYYTLVPMIFARHVLERICTLSGITLAGDFLQDEDFNRLYIDNARSIAFISTDPQGEDTDYLVMDNVITVANHMPEMTVQDFITALRNKLNLHMDYDPVHKVLYLKSREPVFSDRQVIDWSDKPIAGTPVFTMEKPDGLLFTSPENREDELSGLYADAEDDSYIQQDPYRVGNAGFSITSEFTHASVQHVFGPTSVSGSTTWKIPVKDYRGAGEEWDLGYTRNIPALGIYRGMDQDSFGDLYPYGTNDDLSSTENDENNTISLVWYKTVELLWPQWQDFFANATGCRITLAIGIDDLQGIDYEKWYRVGEAEWLVKDWAIRQHNGSDLLVEFNLVKNRTITT